MVRLAYLVAIGAIWISPGCAQARKMTTVDESSDGIEVVLQVGETLEIKLSENGSTGYKWTAPHEPKSTFDNILRERKQRVEAADGPVGSPGVRYLDFEAIGTGTASLELQYRRPWEKDKPPVRRFRLNVRVREAPGR
jgi:inhibitor of cysteine peptidase